MLLKPRFLKEAHISGCAIWSEVAPSWLRQVEAVEILRLVWLQQFYVENNVVQLRGSDDYPSSSILINSPYDLDARRGNKRTTIWTGYKVHLSETCDQDAPHLITYVETTPTSDRDHQVLDELHHNLAQRDILPKKHFVDTGYIDAQLLVDSKNEYNVDLMGPAPADSQWQSRAQKGFGLADFEIDWSQQVVRCPHDKLSSSWTNRLNLYSQPVIVVRFKKSDCHNCPSRLDCTKDKTGVRGLTLRQMRIALSSF
ncbi:MAG TPA: transposase [Cyanophyceae cyanobacterium]